MNRKDAFEFKAVDKAEVELAMKRAHELRSEMAFDGAKSIVAYVKSFFQTKSDVQDCSNLAHSA